MTYFTDRQASPSLRLPRIDPAWILLTTLFAVLLSALVWSDHFVDDSLEDWHGNVKRHATADNF